MVKTISRFGLGLLCLLVLSQWADASSREDINWVKFHWHAATLAGRIYKKAGLMVPIHLKGSPRQYWLQLDTGTPSTVLYQVPLKQIFEKLGRPFPKDKEAVRISGSVAGVRLDNKLVRLRSDADYGNRITPKAAQPIIGSLGLNFFVHRLLLLDFPHQYIAIFDSARHLPETIVRGASFTPLHYRHNEIFVSLSINGESYLNDFLYDAGSSIFSLVTDKALWQQLTGHTRETSGNVVLKVPRWGKTAMMIGAKAKGSLRIGTISVSRPMIYYMVHGVDFSHAPYRIKGLFGSRLFYDHYMVIVDIPHRRFGILKMGQG